MDVTLETERLVLRQPVMADAPRLARLLDNFAVAGNLSRVPYPYRLSDAKWWLRLWRADSPAEETNFAIELPGEGLVGIVGLHADTPGTVIGYWLGEPYWNRGFMSEAAAACVDWFMGTTHADRLHCGAFHFNKASLAIQRKLGFTELSTSTRLCLARGEEVRHIDTELTRTTWTTRQALASAATTGAHKENR